MKTFTRYLLKRLIVLSCAIGATMIMVVWLTQCLRLVDILINQGISLTTFLKLISMLLPDLITILLPFVITISTLFTYNRLILDQELIVLKSVGLSSLKIIKPALILGLLGTILLYSINFYFLPVAFQNFKNLQTSMRSTINTNMIHPGTFNDFKGIMVYVNARQKNGSMTGILVHDARNSNQVYTVTAEYGRIVHLAQGARLVLINGNRHDFVSANHRPAILSFDQYSVDLNLSDSSAARTLKPYERFIHELFDPKDISKSDPNWHKLRTEGHQRILMPLTCLIFVGVALTILLLGEYNRRGQVKKMCVAILSCLTLEAALLALIQANQRFEGAIFLAYVICVFTLIMPFASLRTGRVHSLIKIVKV